MKLAVLSEIKRMFTEKCILENDFYECGENKFYWKMEEERPKLIQPL